ncbi:MAG: helix-turn-helix domain-containing protein [Acidimicrobiia bacterium]
MTSIPTGGRAAELRRQVGPTAWCALECLLERSPDGRTSEASVRAVAADLGVAKNTAHRAIATLARSGLVEAVQRRGNAGRFEPGRYVLHLHELTAPTPPPRGPRRPARVDDAQLTLLPGA